MRRPPSHASPHLRICRTFALYAPQSSGEQHGSVYTENEDKWKAAQQRFHVGNLYLNRKWTGALVGVHPFGGFNMSGTHSKAGGRDFLLLFTQAKAMSRKVR